MKRLLILIAIFCSVLSAKAQLGVGGGSTTVGRISGTVVDSVTKQPLPYVPISLYRSGGKSPINGVLTDDKGSFKLDGVHPGAYMIKLSFMGYRNKTIDQVTTTDSKPDKNLGAVAFAPSTKTLKEVSITGQASIIENKIDKIVYNAEKDLTATGGNATDVLQKVPLVAVDINGNVSLRGDQNVRVLINGKPSGATSASLSDVLKTIPADQIKSIEVITSPSAKYDAEGSAGIINIITKQKNMTGISGSVSGGIGTRQNNGNINLNYNKNRFSLSLNAGGNLTWPQTSLTTFYNDINAVDKNGDPIHTSTNSDGSTYLKRHGAIGNVSANYDFNAFNSLHTNIRLNQGGFDPNSNTQYHYTNFTADSTSAYNSNTFGHNTFGGFDWNLDYTHKFKKEGEELDLSTQWSHSRTVTDFTNYYFGTTKLQDIKNNINGLNNEYTFQADYTLPINKVFKLEAGGKEILRRLIGTSDIFDPVFDTNAPNNLPNFVPDNANSNIYNYNQNVTAAYGVLTVTLPKGYSLLIGARDEITSIHGSPQTPDPIDTTVRPFNNNYNTFIPSLTIQKQISTTQTIKLAYSKRITRPSLQFLNPYDNKSNILAQSQGNPALSPEISQTFEFDYITFIKSSVINTSVYYKHTGGLIESIAEPIVDPTSGESGTLTTFKNIGANNSYGASFFGSVTPFKNITVRGSINAYTYKPDPSGLFLQDKTQDGTYIQYNAFLSGEWDLKSGFIAQVFAIENSPRHTIQGTNPSFSLLGMGVRQQFLKKKASLGINVLEPFNKYKNFDTKLSSPGFSQTSTFAFPFRSVGLTFSYSFGKTTFSNPKTKGVNNDDLKQGDSGSPAGGAGGGNNR